jgi:hypothetical protein
MGHRYEPHQMFDVKRVQAFIVDETFVKVWVFENMTEDSQFAPFRYQEVVAADIEASRLGISAHDHYKPTQKRVKNLEPESKLRPVTCR